MKNERKWVSWFIMFIVVMCGVMVVVAAGEKAAPKGPHMLEGINFQGKTNPGDSFSFMENKLYVVTDPITSAIRPWVDPEDMPEGKYSMVEYEEITVEHEGNEYHIFSEGNLVFTIKQVAERWFEDTEGNEYSTQIYIEN